MNSSYKDMKNLIREKIKAPRLEKREDILKEYSEQEIKDGKKLLCRFFLRGRCIFPAEQCHFSHGVDDLIFCPPDLQEFQEKIKAYKKEGKDISKLAEECVVKKGKEQKRREQPSLELESTFRNLFEFQPRMMEMGELEKPYTQEEIDNNPKIKGTIRDVFQRDLQQKLTYLFFEHYQTPFLPRGFVELCFLRIEWYPKFRKIINSHCCYEVEDATYGPVLVPLPKAEKFDDLIGEYIIKIIKDHNLLQKMPIKSSVIQEYYQNELMASDPFIPHLNYYIFSKRTQLDDVLQSFQQKENFIKKLVEVTGVKEEEIKDKQIFEHEKGENIKQRDEIIEAYRLKGFQNGKSELCRFYMRGLCIFDSKDCKFAHGIIDLKFQKIDIDEFDKNNLEHKKGDDYKEWEKSWVDILKERQPSLNLEFSYRNLFDYQFKLIERGIMSEPFSQELLNVEDTNRREIRVHMHVDMTKEFVDFLFRTYGRKYLRRSFVDKCCQSIGWMTNWNRILDGDFCYEVKLPNLGFVILKIPAPEDLEEFMQDCVVKIIKDNALLDSLPLGAGIISKHFYKDLIPADPTMPTLQIYLKRTQKTLDDFLLGLQADPKFIAKLAKECNKPEEEVKKLVIFDSTSTELNNLMQRMKKMLNDMIEKSHIGFILFNRFEEAVHKKCTKEVERFHTNLGFLRRLMRGIAMASGVLIITLLSETYLFSLKKFKSVDFEVIGKKYVQKLNLKCKRRDLKHSQSSPFPLVIKAPEGHKVEDIKAENLDQEIDLGKIKVVDSEQSLEEAKQVINHCPVIAVDLEGNLSKGGMIELIQVGCGDMIFIFDVYKVNSTEALFELREELLSYIKEVMENPRIVKVFHDCRKDSLALHLFAHCCPVNVFDVSAMHTFIEHLEIYSNFKNVLPLSQQEEESKVNNENNKEDAVFKENFEKGLEILNYIEVIKPPGLNEVLKAYDAPHGLNQLKSVMKKRFEEMPREYFLKRPLDKEYLVYSAKDVEDLIEVKKTIENKMLNVLNGLAGIDSKDLVHLLWKKASRTYVLFGCTTNS